MSLTSIISSHSDFGQTFRDILEPIRPKASQFKTHLGLPAFSADYVRLVPMRIPPEHSAMVGVAFDYLARFLISKYNKTSFDHNELYFYNAFYLMDNKTKKSLSKLIAEHPIHCETFFKSNTYSDQFVGHLIRIAKLEQLARKGEYIDHKDAEYVLGSIPLMLVDDIRKMADIFKRTFFEIPLMDSKSTVLYNPAYSEVLTKRLHGIDADLYYDGVLLDFKTTRYFNYNLNDAYQLIGYYLFHLLDKAMNKRVDLAFENIEQLAFYKARAGQLERFDITLLKKKDVYQAMLQMNELLKLNISANKLVDTAASIY